MKISMSKVLAYLAPIISTIAGVVATWAVVHVHLLSVFHVNKDVVASAIAQAVVFGVTSAGTFLMQHKILGDVIEVEKLNR